MPIYEYACNSCEHTLDALQKISDEPLTDCPECGEAALKRLISAPRFRLKGSGWYETDFKSDKQRNVLKSDSEPDKPKSDKPDKSDKPEKKDAAAKQDTSSTASPARTGGTAAD